MFRRLMLIGMIVAAVFPLACGKKGDLKAGGLKCEYRENPVIDTAKPRFSWKIESERRGVMQASYHLLVASSPDLLAAGTGDLWDSGVVKSGASVHVEYGGKPLSSGTTYWWKVRIKADGVGESAWSEPATFETALFYPEDWMASWIGDGKPDPVRDEDFFKDDPAPLFRKQFTVSKEITRARLYITGLGYYEAYLNGEKIGDAVLDPGWTTFSKRILYSVYDVTGSIGQGDNAFGVMLGNGWYNPVPMRMWSRLNLREHLTVGRPRFLARLSIEYADGSSEAIVSDGTWKTAESPIVRNNIYLGEVYDARREVPGWNTAQFDDSGWRQASEAAAPGGILCLQTQPPVKMTEKIKPEGYTSPEHGVYIFDMGRNFAGWAALKVKGPAGTKVVMRYGELLNRDGSLNVMTSTAGQIKPGTRNQPEGVPVPAAQSDTYILKGDTESETWMPHFTFHGFRFAEVVGYADTCVIDDLVGIRLNADLPAAGTFECSSPLMNDIQAMVRRTFLSNVFSVQSDCPQRERFGYGGDIVPTCEAFMYNFDMSSFYPKILRDFSEAARDNGGLTETAPYVGIGDGGFGGDSGPIGWSLAHPYLLERLYRFYGDERLMREQYDTVKRLVEFIREQTPGHIVDHGIGDHESIDPKDVPLICTAFYYHHVMLLQKMAGLLGYNEDSVRYATLADTIAQTFRARFTSTDIKGVFGNGTQASQATALYYKLARPDETDAYTRLTSEIEKHDRHLSTGIFGTKFLLDVLSENNNVDLAYDIVNQKTFPGWGWMLENGATTLWEHWEFSDNTYSHNHPMFGSVSEWFYTVIAGIRPAPEAVAFDKIIIAPHPCGDLTHAKGTYESIRGPIVSEWTLENDSFTLHVEIPGNTTALVFIPATHPGSVTEGGKPASKAEGIEYIDTVGSRSQFRIGSGSYTFSTKLEK